MRQPAVAIAVACAALGTAAYVPPPADIAANPVSRQAELECVFVIMNKIHYLQYTFCNVSQTLLSSTLR